MLAALVLSCTREPLPGVVFSEDGVKSFHYKVQVSSFDDTRATTAENNTKYVFQATDSLYVSSTDPNTGEVQLFGVLKLIYGAGESLAYFEGDLVGVNEFEPASDTPINVTLVSSGDRIHTTGRGKLTGTAYPDDEYGTTLADAVQKFSHFTCSTTFGNTRFTLTQQSSFLVFIIRMEEEDAPVGRVIDVSLFNNNTDPLRTASITVSEAGSVPFVMAFQGGEVSLEDAVLNLGWTDSEQNDHAKSFDDITDHALVANNYYTISRTTIARRYGGFRVIALANGTITSSNIASLQYSLDEGDTWYNYSSGIPVVAGDEVCFRASAANTSNNKKIYSSAAFAIAGDIVSLLIGSNYGTPSPTIPSSGYTFVNLFTGCTQLEDASGLVLSMTSVPGSAYKSMFEGCTNLVAGPAELPATSIGSTCYRNMFSGCTSLTSAPIIRNPNTRTSNSSNGWYQQMFKDCSSLQEIVFLDDNTFNSTNFQKAGEVGWVSGVNASGTFYVADINNNPFGDNRGEAAIPSGWTVQNYSE